MEKSIARRMPRILPTRNIAVRTELPKKKKDIERVIRALSHSSIIDFSFPPSSFAPKNYLSERCHKTPFSSFLNILSFHPPFSITFAFHLCLLSIHPLEAYSPLSLKGNIFFEAFEAELCSLRVLFMTVVLRQLVVTLCRQKRIVGRNTVCSLCDVVGTEMMKKGESREIFVLRLIWYLTLV